MAQPTTTRTDRPTPANRPSPVPSPPVTSRRQARVTVPTLTVEQGTDLAERLQRRLVALIDLDRADSIAHLGALDLVYQGVIQEHRAEIDEVEELDPVTQDLLIGQTAILEKYHWFVRSHLVDWAGGTANAGATTELAAAQAVAAKAHTPTGSRTTRNAGDAGVSGTAATAATTATAADAPVTAEGR